jgi:hypothetical protein
MMRRIRAREESAVRKAVAYLLLLFGIPSLMLAEDIGWPREMTQNGAQIVYYQPQIDSWSDYRILDARMAIQVTPARGKTTPGVVSIQARTDADKENRTVVISNIKLIDTRFPSADAASAAKLGELVRAFFKPDDTMTISLDRLTAEVEEGKVSGPAVKVDNNPPKIFVSKGPLFCCWWITRRSARRSRRRNLSLWLTPTGRCCSTPWERSITYSTGNNG